MPRSIGHHHLLNNHGNGRELGKLERQYSEYVESTTDVEEVWFAGCHCGSCIFIVVQREKIITHIELCVCTQISVVVQFPTELVTVSHEFLFVG